ncbi:MAG: DUF2294 domain-containing protein [Planctomycetota bacterium]
MPTRGDIERDIAVTIKNFLSDRMGRGPKECRCFLIEDLALVRYKEGLTPPEEVLARSGNGSVSSVRRFRQEIMDASRQPLAAELQRHGGTPVRTILSDVCPETGEGMLLIIFAERPKVASGTRKISEP